MHFGTRTNGNRLEFEMSSCICTYSTLADNRHENFKYKCRFNAHSDLINNILFHFKTRV